MYKYKKIYESYTLPRFAVKQLVLKCCLSSKKYG